MFDIIKEGIKLNQSLALLPLKFARRLAGDKNQGLKQLVDVAEDVVSTPFIAATNVIDSTIPDCKKGKSDACQKAAEVSQGGPSIRNVLVNPEVTVFSDVDIGDGQKRAILTVTGLVCSGWVARVRQTLEGFEQVTKVEFLAEREQFEVTYRSGQPMGDEFREAVLAVVIFPGVRRFLGNVGSSLNNSSEQSP